MNEKAFFTNTSLNPPILLSSLYDNKDFNEYYNFLIDYNKKVNLTAITDKDQVFLKHFYDSILPANLFSPFATVLDIGSGAGFPALPLKLIKKDLTITMLDSIGKKVTFLTEAIKLLSLDKINAVKCRIEDFLIKDFDVVTSRAVAPCGILAEYSLPFVKKGGFALFYKSNQIEEELSNAKNAINKLGGSIEAVYKMQLDGQTVRSFVLLRKIKDSPVGFPRKGNKPRLNPL